MSHAVYPGRHSKQSRCPVHLVEAKVKGGETWKEQGCLSYRGASYILQYDWLRRLIMGLVYVNPNRIITLIRGRLASNMAEHA